MTPEVARRMNRLNESFYRDNARSFDQTRQTAWPGWERCLCIGHTTGALPRYGGARVLDVASGNLRLARYLAKRLPSVRVSYHGIDSCPALARGVRLPEGWDVTLQNLDVVGTLLDKKLEEDLGAPGKDLGVRLEGGAADLGVRLEGGAADLGVRIEGGAADLVACFGFFHHVPTIEARRRLLQELLSYTRTGGLCCVSLWRPMSDRRIAKRARESTRAGLRSLSLSEKELDKGDYLLGWQGRPDTWRYCHHFDEGEIDGLVRAVQGTAELTARFCADGKAGDLNSYLVLTRS